MQRKEEGGGYLCIAKRESLALPQVLFSLLPPLFPHYTLPETPPPFLSFSLWLSRDCVSDACHVLWSSFLLVALGFWWLFFPLSRCFSPRFALQARFIAQQVEAFPP